MRFRGVVFLLVGGVRVASSSGGGPNSPGSRGTGREQTEEGICAMGVSAANKFAWCKAIETVLENGDGFFLFC